MNLARCFSYTRTLEEEFRTLRIQSDVAKQAHWAEREKWDRERQRLQQELRDQQRDLNARLFAALGIFSVDEMKSQGITNAEPVKIDSPPPIDPMSRSILEAKAAEEEEALDVAAVLEWERRKLQENATRGAQAEAVSY